MGRSINPRDGSGARAPVAPRPRSRRARDLIKVLAFGVSKLHLSDGGLRTASGAIIGTPAYMSPEQMISSRDVDHRSDIWAMGVIMHQLATGYLPFGGDDVFALGLRIVNEAPPPPRAVRPEIDLRLDAIIVRCFSKDPAARYQSAGELRRELLAIAPVASSGAILVPPSGAHIASSTSGVRVAPPVSGAYTASCERRSTLMAASGSSLPPVPCSSPVRRH